MALSYRQNLVTSRRRRDDEGEEEGSLAADLEDDSLSEGSIISNGDDDADVGASDISGDEMLGDQYTESKTPQTLDSNPPMKKSGPKDVRAQSNASGLTVAPNKKVMTNGGQQRGTLEEPPALLQESMAHSGGGVEGGDSKPQRGTARETLPEKNRREHMEYLRQKRENPAFVPNRGGFFLHDNRAPSLGSHGLQPTPRGRGRGFHHNILPRAPPVALPTSQQWAHDLHDSISTAPSGPRNANPIPFPPNPSLADSFTTLNVGSKDAPNRVFSTSVLVGKVPVGIYFPGMQERTVVENVAKKKHTLLPHHRPPLRRDKPVRISIPSQAPRYIFPTIERSFVFITRALRPNQQGFGRGRGRSSFNVSRGTSLYGGSNYTPSVTMSRRSSLGGVMRSDGVRSPGGPGLPLASAPGKESGRPVVNFPPSGLPTEVMAPSTTHQGPVAPNASGVEGAALHTGDEHRHLVSALTMHQPRPQKTVSVADIESPRRLKFNPPPQQESPFHQQMPPFVRHHTQSEEKTAQGANARRPSQASRASVTPLSHIPERAIYAQPFQPFNPPLPPPPGYLPTFYGAGGIFYPGIQHDPAAYLSGLGPPTMPAAFLPGNQAPPYMVPPAPAPPSLAVPVPTDGNLSGGMVAHESNGMVYYYDSSQVLPPTDSPLAAPFTRPSPAGASEVDGIITSSSHPFYSDAHSGGYYVAP